MEEGFREAKTDDSFAEFATGLFEPTSFTLKWVGFVNLVGVCLITRKGALVPGIHIKCGGISFWQFYYLAKDAPQSTVQISAPTDMISMLLEPTHTHAVVSERFTTMLLINVLGESGALTHSQCTALREANPPYFLCDTQDEAYKQLSAWRETEQGVRSSFAEETPVADHGQKRKEPEPTDTEHKRPRPEEDPIECVICLDALPSTRVTPCGHVVVCAGCSVDLQDTRDKDTCVQCRNPITTVEDLATGTVNIVE